MIEENDTRARGKAKAIVKIQKEEQKGTAWGKYERARRNGGEAKVKQKTLGEGTLPRDEGTYEATFNTLRVRNT